jgi:drug/metabolite transporter (DMT)-like permease
VVLWASEPALIALLAVLVLRERLTPTLVIALSIALLGMTLVVYSGDLSGSLIGVVLTLGAVLACAVYTVLARILVVETSAVRVTLLQQVAALAFAALLAVVVVAVSGASVGAISSVSFIGWMTAIGSGVLYYGLAFALYLTALQQVPASVAGLFLTLVPVFGVAAALVTGETLNTQQWVGSALVVGSIAIVARANRVPSASVN